MNTKKFVKRDVFYNNGLVNLKMCLDEYFKTLNCKLDQNSLTVEIPQNQDKKYFDNIFKKFIYENKIVFKTKNDRLYWNKDDKRFIYENKYDIKGKSSGNDVKYLYNYITPAEIKISTEEFFNVYIEFAKKNKFSESKIKSDTKLFKKADNFKKEDKCTIPIFMTQDEAVESYIQYCVKGDMIKFDSKIHQFEDGGYCFRDMLSKKDKTIDKWDALVYWFGAKIMRYYNLNYFIYYNSTDLLALQDLKKKVPIDDEKIRILDKKDNIKEIPTNVDFVKQFSLDDIRNKNFYISSSITEFQLKFLMYITSCIYHFDDDYKNSDEDEITKRKEDIFNNFKKASFVSYTQDGDMKSSLNEYCRSYRMIRFLNSLIDKEYLDTTLFKYISDLITAINLSKNDQEKINLNIDRFSRNILKFADLRNVYYDVSFKIFINNKRGLGSALYCFESIYLKEIGRGERIMKLHEISKKIGDGIGTYASNLNNVNKDGRNLLFRLRNIKNKNQMISYFKDLEFVVLRNEEVSKYAKQINDNLEELFNLLESDEVENGDWEVIRDYIAIYAINKYKSVNTAKELKKSKEENKNVL
ncbi:hypothetical protein [Clostridium tyrobutyricum]|uniref:hypothetical protein n=1 Tax=Clostridium tyrobutyricum TaxID=1519 RepID=UPI0011CA3A2E|nr:hypothetical protein [Clostridium tyrobutyricum]